MKKRLCVFVLGLIAVAAQAQLINPGFETWTTDAAATQAMDPDSGSGSWGWWDYNFLNSPFLGSSTVTVFRDSIHPHSGKYCAKITTASMTPTSYSYLKSYFPHDTMGAVFAGTVVFSITAKVKPGIPFFQRISKLGFFYRYAPNGIDTASCSVSLTKWNSVSNSRDIIATGVYSTANATGAIWYPATVNLTYGADTAHPDSIDIVFSSSSLYKNPKIGSMLWIDDASITPCTTPPPKPTITIIGSKSFCQGDSVTLISSYSTNNLWSNGDTTQIIYPDTAGVYAVAYMDSTSCVSVSQRDTTIVKPEPIVTVSGIDTIVSGKNDTLVASGAKSYMWTSGPTKDTDIVSPISNKTYTVTGTASNGCSAIDSFTVVVKVITGIVSPLVNNTDAFYPNPGNGVFNIIPAGISAHSIINIYNMAGQEVYTGILLKGVNTISLTGQSSGIYIYRIISEDGESQENTGKFIIQ